MRWVTYGRHRRAGLVVGELVHGFDVPLIDVLGDLTAAAARTPAEIVPLAGTRLHAPITRPPSVRDFLSFEEHARNATAAFGRSVDPVWYRQPVFYFTNPAAIRGPEDDVPISPGSERFDYEIEVAAVVGRPGADLTPAEAEECIAGYTVLVDWSARDVQQEESRVGLGPAKGKDGATSLGPFLVTPDELADRRDGQGYALRMSAAVNGRPHGGGTWADIRWSFGQMLAYASRGTQLCPGDVVGSGTVGTGCLLELSSLHGPDTYPWLRPGDEVTVEIERLGTVRARITPAPAVLPLEA
ncbi:fumarylacetoacetate hydrolase family protein [Cryptosporangium arvum]|uniref:2-keto-4-pentenoate hydratase/2-oxohepta-3-ene-1,7-dioic acid hydratase n=1 Tax=Cryptosporangium arvum DSM 44712 TaxID=927661 RepID=A0A011AJ77_9ACTN|nr:fumarylacetoacetate hydrolase family protein [Cryptosporangium arvum]EXG82081.1 2-keto-4-pentenoate hydratase/2-oxohepta-3-ene-1,7-dioic acid hydratase [Cryptosporangium arvum DSM 44712]